MTEELHEEQLRVVRRGESAPGAAPGATPGAAPAVRGRRTRRGSRQASRSGPGASPHAGRFRLVTAALVGLAVAALVVAGAIAAGGRSSHPRGQRWSQWSPADGGTQGARDIAGFVAPFYRISAVDQLAVVTVVNLQSASATAASQAAAATGGATGTSGGLQVAVRPNPSSSQVSLLSGNTIAYNLCGIGGKNCAIGVGTPSTARLLLLRREALELALYTFKYIGQTDNVVAILPPGHTQPVATLSHKLPTSDGKTQPLDIALLFQRQELQPLLNQPLSATLPEPVPPTISEMPAAPEAGLVDQITARGLFSEQLQQAQDGSSLIVLDPLPPQ